MNSRRNIKRGQVWMVDLGFAAKVRPCLLLTNFPRDEELALVVVVAHTTAIKNNSWELEIRKPFLKKGAFHFQQIHSIPVAKFVKLLGELTPDEMQKVDTKLRERLYLENP